MNIGLVFNEIYSEKRKIGISVSAELVRMHVQRQNFTLVNLTLESKTSVILENKLEGELSSELGIEEPSTAYILHNQKQCRRHNWT